MRGTQSPHLVALEGVLAVTHAPLPAPTVSAINQGFEGELARICDALNVLHPGQVELYAFDSLSTFTKTLADLIQTTVPYTLTYPK